MSERQKHGENGSPVKRHKMKFEAPAAQSVVVTGSFCEWNPAGHPLKRGHDGVWTTTLVLPSGRYEYRFLTDGDWRDDPDCAERVPNSFGTQNCVINL